MTGSLQSAMVAYAFAENPDINKLLAARAAMSGLSYSHHIDQDVPAQVGKVQ